MRLGFFGRLWDSLGFSGRLWGALGDSGIFWEALGGSGPFPLPPFPASFAPAFPCLFRLSQLFPELPRASQVKSFKKIAFFLEKILSIRKKAVILQSLYG